MDIFGEEVTEYKAPQPKAGEDLVDDQLSEKNPTFNPDLIDRRPEGGWRINASAAVLRLDVPMLMPDADAALLELRPSYTEALAKAPSWLSLPSINLIDGKAKQFDDGLYAAIDLAYYKGLKPRLESHVTLIQRLHDRIAPDSQASAYLTAGLKIAGVEVKNVQPDQVASWLNRFESDARYSKPLSFYTWSEELTQVFRFMRFFQQPLPVDNPGLISELVKAVGSDPKLLEDYKRVSPSTPSSRTRSVTSIWSTCACGVDGSKISGDRGIPKLTVQGNGAVWPVVPPGTSAQRRLDEGVDQGHPQGKCRPDSQAQQWLVRVSDLRTRDVSATGEGRGKPQAPAHQGL